MAVRVSVRVQTYLWFTFNDCKTMKSGVEKRSEKGESSYVMCYITALDYSIFVLREKGGAQFCDCKYGQSLVNLAISY